MKQIEIIDLFCGAGGTSVGARKAFNELGYNYNLTAINHWDIALETHSKNFPAGRHLCEDIVKINPRKIFGNKKIKLMCASPECIHHSKARGGKPCDDQSRTQAWNILRFAEVLYIENILIENVPEFLEWGPLGSDNKPLKSKAGVLFKNFIASLKALNYSVDYKIINCANYGDPTTRQRLFILAKRGRHKITFPDFTHSETGCDGLFRNYKKWIPAKDIIDWSIPGKSIFNRKKPLVPNTIRRIQKGLLKYCSKELQPFIVKMFGTADAVNINEPLDTITTSGGSHFYLAEPFILPQHQGFNEQMRIKSIQEPLTTITTTGSERLCESFILKMDHTSNKNDTALLNNPVLTLTTKNRFALIEPFLIKYHGGDESKFIRNQSINQPIKTLDTNNRFGLLNSFLIKYNKSGENICDLSAPLDTITTKDRFGLIQINGSDYYFDITLRMFKNHELARAHSFPDNYIFCGTQKEVTKQIGNSVPGETSYNLIKWLVA